MGILLTFTVLFALLEFGVSKVTVNVDERWVCKIKTSCLDCLKLSHCSWCEAENICFSSTLPGFEDFCKDNATLYVDFGMSFEDNSKCTCLGEKLDQNCIAPADEDGSICYNRGKCECGRCVCDPTPDPEHPTKTILGEYCELDNFSCDDPRCNEGPYHKHQVYDYDE